MVNSFLAYLDIQHSNASLIGSQEYAPCLWFQHVKRCLPPAITIGHPHCSKWAIPWHVTAGQRSAPSMQQGSHERARDRVGLHGETYVDRISIVISQEAPECMLRHTDLGHVGVGEGAAFSLQVGRELIGGICRLTVFDLGLGSNAGVQVHPGGVCGHYQQHSTSSCVCACVHVSTAHMIVQSPP